MNTAVEIIKKKKKLLRGRLVDLKTLIIFLYVNTLHGLVGFLAT